MKDKINVAELLSNCPKGMELDCTIFENLEFDHINKDNGAYPIICRVKTEWGHYNIYSFTEYGCYSADKYSKCTIFPKGKTSWEGFQRPFEDGDILAYTSIYTTVFIYRNKDNEPKHTTSFYVGYTIGGSYLNFHIYNKSTLIALNGDCDTRLATDEEKVKLFQAIKENGCKWNEDTKTLENLIQPKFKVDDKIKLKGGDEFGIITQVADFFYTIKNKNHTHYWPIKKQDDWELVSNKFDITTLNPFDKVLVRDFDNTPWEIEFFSRLLDGNHFKCFELSYVQCIPYEGNEHLLGKTDDCDEYFKTWK